MPPLRRARKGLRLPCLPTGFDALCWGIIGQQINVKFAGRPAPGHDQLAGENRRHARPSVAGAGCRSRIAHLNKCASPAPRPVSDRRAEAVAKGALDIEGLPRGSAMAAEKKLTAQRGIGVWTARYVMMRGGLPTRRRWATAPWPPPCNGCTNCRNARIGPDRRTDAGLRAASQPRHHASVDQPERSVMNEDLLGHDRIAVQRISPPGWTKRAVWCASISGPQAPPRSIREAENNRAGLDRVAAQVREYAGGKRRDFAFEPARRRPEFNERSGRR